MRILKTRNFGDTSFGGQTSLLRAEVSADDRVAIQVGSEPEVEGPVSIGDRKYATIQAAVNDAVAGDVIEIAEGVYEEQVTVTDRSDLTIRAAEGAVVTIKAPPGALAANGEEGDYAIHAIIAVNDSTNVTIEGVTVDGDYAADRTGFTGQYDTAGIAYLGSSGAIDGVTVRKVGNSVDPSFFGVQKGNGILLDGNGAEQAVSVTGSTITDFQKTGVYADQIALTFTGNTVTGIGATALTAQNAMQVGRSSGLIDDNALSGFGYTGGGWYSSGIIAFEPSGELAITNNAITGAGAGSAGIDLSDTAGVGVAVTGNTLSDLDYGLYGYTYSGGAVGFDADPDLSGNSFSAIGIEGVHFAPEESFGDAFTTDTDFSVAGSDFADLLAGSAGDDSFAGGAGADTLTGGAGDDVLTGGAGADVLDGGAGVDTAAYDEEVELAIVDGRWTADGEALTGVEIVDDAAEGRTLLVGAGGFATIGEAIAAANDGDTVLIAAGIYDEDVVFSKSLIVLGAKAGLAGTDADRSASAGTGETNLIGRHDITATGGVIIDGLRFVNDATTTGGGDAGAILGISTGAAHQVTNSIFWSAVNGAANGVDDRAIFVSPIASGSVGLSGSYVTGAFPSGFSGGSWGRGVWFNGGGVVLGLTGNTFEYTRTALNLDMANGSFANIESNEFRTAGTAVSVGLSDDRVSLVDNSFVNVGGDLNYRNVTDGIVLDAATAVDAVTPGATGGLFNIRGGAFADSIGGTEFADLIEGNASDTPNTADADVLEGRAGNDVLSGAGGSDTLDGGADDDTLSGGAGDDRLVGGAGTDALNGGDGIDTAAYAGAATVARSGSGWTVTDAGGTDTLSGVEIVDDAGSGRTLLVGGGGFATIQAAVNAAQAGDTVLVSAGTYNENVVIATSGITLLSTGGREATTIRGASGEVTLRLAPGANDVTIGAAGQGFTIVGLNGSGNSEGAAIYLDGAHRNIDIVGNDVVAGGDVGLLGQFNAAISDVLIQGNVFSGKTFVGDYPQDAPFANQFDPGNNVPRQLVAIATGSSDVRFLDNTVSGTAGGETGAGTGVFRGNQLVTIDAADALVQGNSFTGNTYAGGYALRVRGAGTDVIDNALTGDSAGILVDNKGVAGTYSGNSFTGDGGADMVFAMTPGDDVVTTNGGNDVLAGGAGDDRLDGGAGNDTLSGGAGDDALTGGDGVDTAVYTGQRGAYVVTGTQVDGRYTSFTGVSGPEGTDTLTGVEVLSFANGQVLTADAPVQRFAANGDLVGTYSTVQAAIDAAQSGDKINVAAGDYAENLVITTNGITLQGAPGRGSIIRPGTSDAQDGNLITVRADGVTIKGFTLDGANAALDAGSNGVVLPDGVESHAARIVSNYKDSLGGGFATDNLTVTDNAIMHGQRFGVVFANDGASRSGGNLVENNDFSGMAGLFATSQGSFYRIGVLLSTEGYADIKNNRMVNVGEGIQASTLGQGDPNGTPLEISGNTISAQRGIMVNNIYSAASTVVVKDNDISFGTTGGGGAAGRIGIRIWSVFNGGVAQFEDNDVSGAFTYGYRVSNVTSEIRLVGGTVAGAQVGVELWENYGFGRFQDADENENRVVLEGLTITGATVANTRVNDDNNARDGVNQRLTLVFDAENPPVLGDAPADVVLLGDTAGFEADGYDGDLVVTGDADGNELAGGDGDDLLSGGAGGDMIDGGAGNDTLDGGVGADTMRGGAGDDAYVVDDAGDVVTELANGGTDRVSSSISYALTGAVENLTLTGAAAVNGTGNGSNNLITGNVAANALDGADGDDTLVGGAGADALTGGLGEDRADYAASEQGVTVNLVTGAASGGDAAGDTLSGIENVTGSGQADALTGGAGRNVLNGGAGADTLDGGAGIDRLVGGAGDDLYVADDSADAAVELAGEGTDTVRSSASYTLGENLENLTLTGTAALTGTGNGESNVLTGNAGANTLIGGAGADTLDGGADGSAKDVLIGGEGDDLFVLGTGDTAVEGSNEGVDTVRTTAASFTLGSNLDNLEYSGAAKFTGVGNGLANRITGGAQADKLDGKGGVDTLVGLGGDDLYTVDNAADLVIEDAQGGTDRVEAFTSYALGAGVENLTLRGTAANGTGNALNNVLIGNGSANLLSGGMGDDRLDGGTGADTLNGGEGNDTFTVSDAGDLVQEAGGEGTDTVLSNVAGYTLTANVENLTLVASAAVTGIGNGEGNLLTGNAGANTLDGLGGNDTLNGGAGADVLRGGVGDDTYLADAADDLVEDAGAGTDTVLTAAGAFALDDNLENLVYTGTSSFAGTGNTSANDITGGARADTLDGGAGADTLRGLAGDDLYLIDAAGDVIEETSGIDTVRTTLAAYTLAAGLENLETEAQGSGNRTLTGNAAANRIAGGSGADTLDGGAGADTLTGGAGDDTYVLDDSRDMVVESANGGIDTVRVTATSFILGSNLESLEFVGTGNFSGIGNTASNRIVGGSGNDTLDGGQGVDVLNGGAGDDTYLVDSDLDLILETSGTDTVRSTAARWVLYGGLENIVLLGAAVEAEGNDSDNVLTGNSNNNRLDGSEGADTMVGGKGDDVFVVDDAGDVVTERAKEGTDTVETTLASYRLSDTVERLVFTGTGNFSGTGSKFADTITGGTGNDVLDGAGGDDRLVGGDGSDTYMVNATGDRVTEGNGAASGVDQVLSTATSYTLDANVEQLRLLAGATNGTGNSGDNLVVGNGSANRLDGGAGVDELRGGDGNDTFVFRKGQADGDKVADFTGAGAASGDVLRFESDGLGGGAPSLTQVGNTDSYVITWADGAQETVQIVGVFNLDLVAPTNDYTFVSI